MHGIALLLLAAILALTPTLARSQVRLEFGWPDGLQATVTHTKSRTRIGLPAASPGSVTTLYDLKVSQRPVGLVVSHSNARLDPASTPQSLTEVERRQLELLMKASLPAYVINRSGDFVRIDDAGAFRASLLQWFGQSLSALAHDPNLRRMLDQVTSDEFLNAVASADWGQAVGFWAGATLEPGEAYTSEYRGPIPLLPTRTVRMSSVFKVNGEVACDRGGQARRCVEIEMRTIPDQGELAGVIEAILGKAAPQGADKPRELVESIDLEQSLLLVTEPDGLIPHRLSTRKKTTVISRVGTSKNTASEILETTAYYVYRPNAP